MPDIEITWDGLDAGERRMSQFAALLLDLRPFWPRVVPLFIDWMRLQFETEGGFAGSPWAPLSPGYLAWKAGRYPGRGILVAEGNLRQAASRPTRRATPSTLTLTVKDPKLRFHQEGTSRMPARPLIFESLPAAARLDLDRAAGEYVDDLVRRLGA